MAAPETQPLYFVVIGAGVIGLSTALSLRAAYPDARITIIADHFPGEYHPDYTSPWAGGNWCSAATDNGLLESFDRVTFERFARLAETHPECGIQRSPLRMVFDQKIEDAGILSQGTGKIWYEKLVGGLTPVDKGQLSSGAVFGLEMNSTFVINCPVYLQWLFDQCRVQKMETIHKKLTHIEDAFLSVDVLAIFNCTGLGSSSLGGVEDKSMYPTRGQTVLVEQPNPPLERMYFRSPRRVDNDTTYIFQRPLGGGVVLGGCREDGNWNTEVDAEFAKDIMRRCCALAPELGRPEDLKVIRHGVGLRPSRKGGPRNEVEVEPTSGFVIIHNYGASGAGYQASWGMAEYSVKLCEETLNLKRPKAKL